MQKDTEILLNTSDFKQLSLNRTFLVNSFLGMSNGKSVNLRTSAGDSNRFFNQRRFRQVMKRFFTQAHKSFGTTGSQNCDCHICKRNVSNNHPYLNGQPDRPSVFEDSRDWRVGVRFTANNSWI